MDNVKITWVLNKVTANWVCYMHESEYDPADRLIGSVHKDDPNLNAERLRLTHKAAALAFGPAAQPLPSKPSLTGDLTGSTVFKGKEYLEQQKSLTQAEAILMLDDRLQNLENEVRRMKADVPFKIGIEKRRDADGSPVYGPTIGRRLQANAVRGRRGSDE